MRPFQSGLLLLILLLVSSSLAAQQTSSTSAATPASDPQAVSVVTQALAVAGGATAILTIADYRSSGSITYHQSPGQDVQGTVTLSGRGLFEFRQDAILPSGMRSYAINEHSRASAKYENGMMGNLNFNYQVPLMTSAVFVPCWQLAAALNDPLFALSFKGTTQIDGYTVYDIRVQESHSEPPDTNGVVAEYFGVDFFIDATNFQIRMIQDVVIQHLGRKVRYSDYRPVNGVLVPFLIDEELDGRRTQTIQLEKVGFNAGLKDSDFDL